MITGKTIALTRRTLVGKVMSLLLNILSRLVITFLPRSKRFNFLAAVTICRDFGAPKNKVWHCFHCFPIYFPCLVIMNRCESWTIKKAEHWRIDPFQLWCWRKPLKVPWTTRRSNQSILKEISPEYSLEGLMLNLKLQHFGHLMRRTDTPQRLSNNC